MNIKIQKLLANQGDNYILPFFWQHGEDEATLREYMAAIYNANIRAVCVESRPHPDFAGPLWWRDMDIILDEARKRGMKVWILDDAHFPTGYANGALRNAPARLHRQSIVCQTIDCAPGSKVMIGPDKLRRPPPPEPTELERLLFQSGRAAPQRIFPDDRLLGVFAARLDCSAAVEMLDLSDCVIEDALEWTPPAGKWRLYILHLSRNFGARRDYINMLDAESCRMLIDAVYEPHYARYAADFGKTIAGFFSDEPELGNGHLYDFGNVLGVDQDLPWSRALEQRLAQSLGEGYPRLLPLLWENEADAATTARVRYAYMDAVTRLVETCFSQQIRQWCEAHGVEYIGHVIEDSNQHARTGSSLGHFFRGLSGQHMAGVDLIARQVMPQGEDRIGVGGVMPAMDHEFFHFVLAKLGASHAAIDPLKRGRALCEIFGAYGWGAGVRLQKYLTDHCLVRGINHFVPHAFSPKEFPDPDCPPHFYAGGHDAQYRHFGHLMAYMNRVCELLNGGRRIAPVALLYHAEAEWTGRRMLMQKPARLLTERQIDFDIVPQDVFLERERYRTVIGPGLRVHTQEYRALIVPTAQFVTEAFARSVLELREAGFPVAFIDALPEGLCNGDDPEREHELLTQLQACDVVPLQELIAWLDEKGVADIAFSPPSHWLRYLRYRYEDGGELYCLVNEGATPYRGTVRLPNTGPCYAYNAWDNRLERLCVQLDASQPDKTAVQVEIEPLKSLLILFDRTPPEELHEPVTCTGQKIPLRKGWMRSLCAGIEYPRFGEPQAVDLPDRLAEEAPRFSGFVRYETDFHLEAAGKIVLEITDAHEGVEVFVNGRSAGVQIAPPFRFDISNLAAPGENRLRIEVATTLERQVGAEGPMMGFTFGEIISLSGVTGEVNLFIEKRREAQ